MVSINAEGDFMFNIQVKHHQFNLCCSNRSDLIDTPTRILAMLNEMQQKIAVLDNATDMDVDILLMQCFAMDLLGRDSNSAAIFKAKTEEE